MTTKSWLREDLHMSKPEAGRRMKLLRFLDNFPIVRAAYRGGELATEHVSALLSALMSLPPAAWDAVEGPFVEQARFGSPQDVSDMVDDILTALGVTKKSDIQRERRNGALGFRLTKTMDGHYSASGRVDPASGELIRAVLDAHNESAARTTFVPRGAATTTHSAPSRGAPSRAAISRASTGRRSVCS